MLLSFQWRSCPEPWLWLYTRARRVRTHPVCFLGLFTRARGLCCSSTTKWTISLHTTSDECLWTCSTAHGISICPEPRFGICEGVTGGVCLVLVVKKSQWHDDDYCSFVSIKDLCPCKNQLCAVDHTCVSSGSWMGGENALCTLWPAGMMGIRKMSNPRCLHSCQACRASLTAILVQG